MLELFALVVVGSWIVIRFADAMRKRFVGLMNYYLDKMDINRMRRIRYQPRLDRYRKD